MPGPTHSPREQDARTSVDQSVDNQAVGAGISGVGAQGRAHQMQSGMGNAAAAAMVGTPSGSSVPPTWRETGNLRGSPPVRNEKTPPNTGIVEDQDVYTERLVLAEGQLARQHKNADKMLGTATDPFDNRFWFTKVYSFVTEEELRSIEGGIFYYPSYVLQCVRYFDQIYQDNLDAYDNGESVEEHWQRAFEVCADEDGYFGPDLIDLVADRFSKDLYRSFTSLVSSMQAHIRYDLPRAEAWVFNSYYKDMDGANIKNFEPDFMSMMDIFDRAALKMNTVLTDLHNFPVDLVPRTAQDLAMSRWFDADMATERAETWQRADALLASGTAGPDPYSEGSTPGYEHSGALTGNITKDDHMSDIQSLGGTTQPLHMDRGFLEATAETVGMDGKASLNPANWFGDHLVREDVNSRSLASLATESQAQRTRWMRRCAVGVAWNGDENTIIRLVAASKIAGDLVATIDAANAYDLLYSMNGDQYAKLRATLRADYYPKTSTDTAMNYIRRCMIGDVDEWHETMIMDILEAKRFVNPEGEVAPSLPLNRSQAHMLIEKIGLEFEGGGYAGGLIQLEQTLDFGDENRLHKQFGKAPNEAGDTRVRRLTHGSNLEHKPLVERVAMVRRLLEGATLNADEQSIIRILNASKKQNDLVQLIDRVGAVRMARDINGDEWKTVKKIFQDDYYTQADQSVIKALLKSAINRDTEEWEEEMIADILTMRKDGYNLIRFLGNGEGFHEGLNKVEWNLDGADQDRIEAVFGTSGKFW